MAARVFLGTVNSAFENAANWDGGTLPTSGADSIDLQATCVFNGSISFLVGDGQTLDGIETLTVNTVGGAGALTFHAGSIFGCAGGRDIDTDFTFNGAVTGGSGIDVDGSVVFTEGMDWSGFTGLLTVSGAAGTHTITFHGATGPAMTIAHTGATAVAATDIAASKSFTVNTGAARYNNAGFAHNIGGNIAIGATAVLTGAGLWTQTANGTVANPTATNAFHFHTDVVSTLVANIILLSLSGAGLIDLVAQNLVFYPTGHNFYAATCSYTSAGGKVVFYPNADLSNAAIINLAGIALWVASAAGSRTLTVAGRLTCGTLMIYGQVAGFNAVIANGGLNVAGAVSLGRAAEGNRAGRLTLAGACVLGAGLAAAGTATTHELNLGGSSTRLTGTITGTNIVFTNATAYIVGGTLTACNLGATVALPVYYGTDGGGNTNVNFIKPSISHPAKTGGARVSAARSYSSAAAYSGRRAY